MMKYALCFGLFVFAAQAWAVEPLTDAEKTRLAEVETAAKRTAAMREAAQQFSAARKVYTEDRHKFPAERDPQAGKVFQAATAKYEQALRRALLQVDPKIEPLLNRRTELQQLGLDRANEGETVADADSQRNAAMLPIQDVPGLPRVLLIGDSISIGYTLAVREKLRGKANVHRIPQNGGATEVGLAKIEDWLGKEKWDVIHFNFGLHDAKYASATTQRSSREQYAENLRKLVTRMKATGAKLIFATTTPVPLGGVLSPTRKFDSIEARNQVAVQVMQENHVAIDDLFAVAAPIMDQHGRPNDVHFAPAGYEVLGKAVAESIQKQLGSR